MGEIILIAIVVIAAVKIYKYLTEKPGGRNAESQQRDILQTAQNNIAERVNVGSRRHEETGTIIYFANDRYNLPDREYRFNYRYVNGSWRAYIIRTPDLRNGQYGIPHVLSDGNMRYICWDRSVNTLKDMQNISRQWADNVQKYIATGSF